MLQQYFSLQLFMYLILFTLLNFDDQTDLHFDQVFFVKI